MSQFLRAMELHMAGEVRFKQLLAGQFSTDGGISYSLIGLSEDGRVFRYDPKCSGWIPWPMTIAECREQHEGKR
jgi:hypothetical protein